MTPDELDQSLDELETRLERLQALYNQYFMGIEKIEPTVIRKDVDRRIWVLRREQIRNTMRRFRLQTIVSRYNTFAQYWMRICREIENGTYVRHVLKAEKRFGQLLTIQSRKRFGKLYEQMDSTAPPAPDAGDEAAPPSRQPAVAAAGATRQVEEEIGSWLETGFDPLAEASRAVDQVLGRESSLLPPANRPSPGPASTRQRPPLQPAPKPAARAPLQSAPQEALDLDLDFGAETQTRAATPTAREQEPPPAARPALQSSPGAARPPAQAKPTAPAQPPAQPARPAAPAPAVRPAAPAPAARPAAPQAPAPRVAAPAPATPAAPRQAPATPAARAPDPRPAVPAARPAASPPAAASKGAGLSQDRVREIHARLQAAKAQVKDGTAVSLDALSRQINDSLPKLRAKHGGKSVDFDVVIKDGKAVLKPIVKG